ITFRLFEPRTDVFSISFSVNPIRLVTADRGIIAELTGDSAERRFDFEIARAHAIDELPDTLCDFAANPLPFFIVQPGPGAGYVCALIKHAPVQTLVQTWRPPAQRVVTAAG